jgi:hypothetical protein
MMTLLPSHASVRRESAKKIDKKIPLPRLSERDSKGLVKDVKDGAGGGRGECGPTLS